VNTLKRSKLRIIAGKLFYRVKRQIDWSFSDKKFARIVQPEPVLPYVLFHHATPLIRKLSTVEQWLQHNKVKNLAVAIPKVNGLILRPGEVFSLWLLVGKPTKAKGYTEGFVLENGKAKPGIGGGLCQLSNLIYWMTLHTPLTVIERWRHSYDVFPDCNRTIPFGSGATCSFPTLDLQIYNSSTHIFQLLISFQNDHLTGEWRSSAPAEYSYQIYEAYHEITSDLWGRYLRHNRLHRRVFDANMMQIGDEFITENHALMMYEPLLTTSLKSSLEKGDESNETA
jgi:vancomycin resistance protein VanW